MGRCAYKGCEDRYTRRVPAPGPGNQTLDVCVTHALTLEDMMKKLCLVTGCDRLHAGKGFCNRHYGRFYGHGLVPEAGVSTNAEADAVQAAWEAKRAEAETAKGTPKPAQPKAPPRGKAPAAKPSAQPVQRVPEEVIEPLKVPKVLRELPDAPGKAKIAKLEAQVKELSAARDRLAVDTKTLREENRRLSGEVERQQAEAAEVVALLRWADRTADPEPTVTTGAGRKLYRMILSEEAADDTVRLVVAVLDEFGAPTDEVVAIELDPGETRPPRPHERLRALVSSLREKVAGLEALDARMEPVREALSALGLPAMDSYADAVRELVRQRDEALAAPAQRPAEWRDDLLKGAKKDRDRYAEDLRRTAAKLNEAEKLIADYGEAINKNAAVEAQLRAEIAALRGSADTVRRASPPVSPGSYLSDLLQNDSDLRDALFAAISRDTVRRARAKDGDALIALLTSPATSPAF